MTIPAAEGSLAGTYTVGYTYTLDGQLKSTKYPTAGGLNTETVGVYYDSRGIPEWMGGGLGWGVYVAGTQYSVYGEPLVVDLGSSYSSMVNYSYEYGTRRLEGTWLQRETASTYDIDLTYDYDAAGNIKRIGDAAASADTQCFTYDDQRRLTGAWTPSSGSCASAPSASALGGPAPYWQSYAYDAAGNRTSSTVHAVSGNRTTSYTRPAAGTAKAHTLTSSTTTGPTGSTTNSYTYDAAGNTVTRTIAGAAAQTLTWDTEGRLDTLTQGGVVHDYTYTADGERLIRREGATTTVYLPGGEELTRVGATGAVKASRYYTFGGETVAVRTATGAAGVNSLVGDHHDTPGIAINNATNALTRRYHDPFGNPRGSVTAWIDDRGFINKSTDASSLTQIGARYYDPGIGAFISPDPVLDTRSPQQWNPYPYSVSNPTTYSDPTGLFPSFDDVKKFVKDVADAAIDAATTIGKAIIATRKRQSDITLAIARGVELVVTKGAKRVFSAAKSTVQFSNSIGSGVVNSIKQAGGQIGKSDNFVTNVRTLVNIPASTLGFAVAESSGAACSFNDDYGITVCQGAGGGKGSPMIFGSGTEYGSVFVTPLQEQSADAPSGLSPEAWSALIAHESRHATQWALFGGDPAKFVPVYLGSRAAALVLSGNADCNLFEWAADFAGGGYVKCM